MIRETYSLLQLHTFYTSGPTETRAWTVRAGTAAPAAAGKIHTDFERGFIRAETVSFCLAVIGPHASLLGTRRPGQSAWVWPKCNCSLFVPTQQWNRERSSHHSLPLPAPKSRCTTIRCSNAVRVACSSQSRRVSCAAKGATTSSRTATLCCSASMSEHSCMRDGTERAAETHNAGFEPPLPG